MLRFLDHVTLSALSYLLQILVKKWEEWLYSANFSSTCYKVVKIIKHHHSWRRESVFTPYYQYKNARWGPVLLFLHIQKEPYLFWLEYPNEKKNIKKSKKKHEINCSWYQFQKQGKCTSELWGAINLEAKPAPELFWPPSKYLAILIEMPYLPAEQAAICILFLPVPDMVCPVLQLGDDLEMSKIPLRLSIWW